MENLVLSRYSAKLKFPLNLKCVLLVSILNGLCKYVQFCECTMSVEPLVVDEGSRIDNILTQLGLKKTLVGNAGENPEDKTFFGEDVNGTPIVVGSWFDYGSYTLAMAIFGTTFLVTCVATAVYYVLFVVTDPTQLRRKRAARSYLAYNSSSSAYNSPRSFSNIIKAIGLAYETYETLDFNDLDCQKRILCELQIGDDMPAQITRQVSTLFTHLDLLNERMPNMKEFTSAIDVGQNQRKNCSAEYENCRFSLSEFNSKFKTLW